MSTNSPTISASMSEAMGRLWVKFLPEIENRTAILESAVSSLTSGSLSDEEREAAHQAAHKLAGVLGTFGLQRGTELARQAELAFSEKQPAYASELSVWVSELRSLIESRK